MIHMKVFPVIEKIGSVEFSFFFGKAHVVNNSLWTFFLEIAIPAVPITILFMHDLPTIAILRIIEVCNTNT